jgi:hypothetical protein
MIRMMAMIFVLNCDLNDLNDGYDKCKSSRTLRRRVRDLFLAAII